jgi:hypothetical protein
MIKQAFGFAAITALLIAPAGAHHSTANFDQTKTLLLSGTVKQFELINPHAWLHIVVAGENGQTSTWTFEGGSPAQLVTLGWSKDGIKPGEKIQVGYRPMKDGSRGGQLMSVTLPSGQKVCSNRGCGDGTGAILGL